ncbi:MAG TPA: hypothetical protein VKF36_04760 [Syntrophorhabdales bacterium]|nr:hypothetical protein [Syntrophorhabdales bacterium]
MHKIRDSRRILVVLLVLVMSMTGCGSIRLIAPYDQKIDDGVTDLQKATAEFFTGIERQGGSTPTDYQNHTRFYDYCKVSLSGLIVRAGALSANSLTLQQLEILRQQFQDLEADDQKMGIPQAAVPQYEKAFNRTFTAILTLEVAKKERKTEGAGE